MAFTILLCLVVALLAHSSSATASTYSQELCTTKFGGAPVATVPSTYSIVVTLPAKVVVTSTPILDITPPPVTDTITSTSTTLITSTTTTATVSQTATVTTTVSTTDTITATTTTVVIGPPTTLPQSTSTVPTSPGFMFPSPVPAQRKAKRAELEGLPSAPQTPHPRDLANRRGAAKQGRLSSCKHNPHGPPSYYPPIYPTSVVCGELVEVVSTKTVTKTASTSTTTLPAVTDTITTTATSTSIVDVAASTTVVTTETDTATSTTSVTTTVTSTSTNNPTVTPTPILFYAACAPSNLVAPPPGNFFESESYSPPTIVQNPSASTAYDCCVACITNPFCKVAEFSAFDGPPSCQLDFGGSDSQCGSFTVLVGLSSEFDGSGSQAISEGNCNAGIVFQG